MPTVFYDFRSETGARLNSTNTANPTCIFRADQDSNIATAGQYTAVTISNSNTAGVILIAPTGNTPPGVTAQTTASPGTGNQHYTNEILWNDAQEAEIRLRYLLQIPSQMTSNGINIREFTLMDVQAANVGGNENHWAGVHVNVDSSNVLVHQIRHCRSFNEGNFTVDATTADTITEGTEFAANDYLLFVLYKRLPGGVGATQVAHNFKVYNMGSTFTTTTGMLDWASGTIIAQTQGSGEWTNNSADHDAALPYGYLGCSASDTGNAVGPRLTLLQAEQYSTPALTMGSGFPSVPVFPLAGGENVYMPLQLGRSGNTTNCTILVASNPSTTGITVTVIQQFGTMNTGVVGALAASNAQTGAGIFVLRAAFYNGATADLTVGYTAAAAPRAGGTAVYLSGKPINIPYVGSSTIQNSGPAFSAAMSLRFNSGSAQPWVTLGYGSEAAGLFGFSSTYVESDWSKDEAAGSTSPGAMGRLIATSLSPTLGVRKAAGIVPASNTLSSSAVATTLPHVVDFLQYIVNQGIDWYGQDIGIRFSGTPVTAGMGAGATTSTLRLVGGNVVHTAGTYNGYWAAVNIGGSVYDCAEIATHTVDSNTSIFALTTQAGQTQPLASAPSAGTTAYVHTSTFPDKIKAMNVHLLEQGTPTATAYIQNSTLGTRVSHQTGWFRDSVRRLSGTDWTHQDSTGDASVAALITGQVSEAMLSGATVVLTPPTASMTAGQTQGFSVTVGNSTAVGTAYWATGLIPTAGTFAALTGTMNTTSGMYTAVGAADTVRNVLRYNTSRTGTAQITVPAAQGGNVAGGGPGARISLFGPRVTGP